MSIKKSFSLIEVLIFVTILSVFLVIAAAIITASMRQNTLKIDMLKATHYNEQLLDWIRNEKEMDWKNFVVKGSVGGGTTYCFINDTWSTWPSSGGCTAFTLENMYKRYAILTIDNATFPTQVTVKIYAEWQEAGNNYSNQLGGLFTVWE